MDTQQCVECGKPFAMRHPLWTLCSEECRTLRRRKRQVRSSVKWIKKDRENNPGKYLIKQRRYHARHRHEIQARRRLIRAKQQAAYALLRELGLI